MSKKLVSVGIELMTIVAFTLLWAYMEHHVEHASEWLLGVAILRQMLHNYLHGLAHTAVHKLVHVVMHLIH